MKVSTFILSLFLLGGVLFGVYFLIIKPNKKPLRFLPYLGETINGSNHQVPSFSFKNQNGVFINDDSLKNKIYVCEYFFVTCQSICPIMNKNMKRICNEFEKESNFYILSHTVNPENDSVEVLLDYVKKLGVENQKKWHFLTGSKKEIYEIARTGYLLNNEKGNGGPEDFIHTQMFVLVDWNKNLRGFYDGTKSEDMEKLKIEIRLLLEEQLYMAKN